MEARKDFVDTNQPSTSVQVIVMLEIFEQLIKRPPTKKVSKLKDFFKSCLALIYDKDVVIELTALIEDNTEHLRPEKRVNQIRSKRKIDRELRMTTQIGDYDMDYIILELDSDVNILTIQTWESMNRP